MSSGSPFFRGWCRRWGASLERRSFCSLGPKTLAPKTSASGWVRSVVPSAPPLALHCAARTFGWRVRVEDMRAIYCCARERALVQVDKARAGIFATLTTTCGAARSRLPDMLAAINPAVGIDTIWVIVAGVLVMFMQAGFAFLEIGFSRQKNAGTIVAKILANFSIAAICYWAVGFAFAFGAGKILGHKGFS